MNARIRDLLALTLTAAIAGPAFGSPGKPLNLRCEHLVNPLGLGTKTPRLTWQVNDEARGAAQKAYQVVVSTDPQLKDAAAMVWDSGKVESDQSVLVPYGGKPVASGTRYYWQVRTWDAAGKASEYSEPAWWEMALLAAGDWKGRWITTADKVEAPKEDWGNWIWNDAAKGNNKTAYFRYALTVPEKPESAYVRLTADNSFVLYVNGQKAGHGEDLRTAYRYDLTAALKPGINIIAVQAVNVDGPAGLVATGRVVMPGGKDFSFKSGPDWKSAPAVKRDWLRTDYDDSNWAKSVVIARYGEQPWGKFPDPVMPRRSQLMRKTFTAKSKVARARVYATGLGMYELSLNGRRVGDHVFAPGWTHYPKRIQYQTYDVTELLKEGENAIGAILGNGWWSGGLGWKGENVYSNENLRLKAQLNIEYADGSRDIVATDESWQTHASPITRDSLYHGETYDARLEATGWDGPGFKAEGWAAAIPAEEKGTLAPQESEPIRVTQELPVQQIAQVEKGVYVLDFGQNAAARVRMKVKGPKGTKVRLRFAEVLLPNGQLYRDNYRSAEATDYYICKGEGEEIFEPRFTYRGFRYCEVTGYPGTPKAESFTSCVVHSASPAAGSFSCSHWLMNQVQSNVVWGARSNFMSVPTDCPQRDERLGWMGDAQAFAPTACWNLQLAGFWGKWLHDITDSQAADGATTDVAPVIVVGGPAAPGWGDAIVTVPWTVYQYYGDKRIIEDNYAPMVAWVEYMRGQSKGGLYEREGYSDWVSVVPSPKAPVGAAYCYRSTLLLARMAAAIGRTEDARKYSDLAGEIAAAFNRKFLSADNNYTGGTQSANLLPLMFGITPADKQQAVADNIARDVKAHGDHLTTGFLGTPLLLPALTQFKHHDLAWNVAAQSTYPSLGYMARQGATTVWERWDTDKQGPGMNSHNHFALGALNGQWVYEALAGINIDPEHPGFKRVIIRPQPVAELSWAKAEYPSPYGLIKSSWRRTDEGLALDVTIPANTTADVWIPIIGKNALSIVEGSTPLLLDGNNAQQAEGVKMLRNTSEAIIFEVGAGTYHFGVAG